MRMTRKSQVTVPKTVREALGVGPGSNVGFEKRGDAFVLVNLDTRLGESPGAQLVRHLQESTRRLRAEGKMLDLTTDEIMEMTRGPFDDLDPR